MKLSAIFTPWKRAAALERENQRLRDCLEHEEQRNFDYMFQRMAYEQQRVAHIEAMNKHLLNTAVDLSTLSPRGPIFFDTGATP